MDANGIVVNMTPAFPGEFIRTEIIRELGLNVTKTASILGVRRATLSDLVNGNSSLSPAMVLRIEKAFGVNKNRMLRMQVWHDARRMRDRTEEINVLRFNPE